MSALAVAPRIAILGAGIIGLTLAYELAVLRRAHVTLYDPNPPGQGASWAAAGMLAPAFEASFEAAFEAEALPGVHPRLFELARASAALWPRFAAELAARAAQPVTRMAAPTLAIARNLAESAGLDRLAAGLTETRTDFIPLTSAGARTLEPALSPDTQGGLLLPTDTGVNNREVITALLAVLRARPNVTFIAAPAPLRAVGGVVRLAGHDVIVAAAGWQTAALKVEENGALYSLVNWDTALDDIDGCGGQMLAVAAGPGAPSRIVRAGHIYLVPRGKNLIIGATVEPGRALTAPEPAAIGALHTAAIGLCPGLADLPITDRWTGTRPGTPDAAPFLGQTQMPGLFVAAGHYRNGILLAPVTANILAAQIFGEDPGELAASFCLHRPRPRLDAPPITA
jgi:glycine oxidase